MNKFHRTILAILIVLIFVIYPLRYKIGGFYYTKINPDDSIKILTLDLNDVKGYTDIIKIVNTKGNPSFVYFNTPFSYDRLINDKVNLLKLDSLFRSNKLNLVYIAKGLENEPKEKDKWIVKINKLNLIGTHVSLPDTFSDFDSFFKITKLGDGHQIMSVPHYLLANRQNIITDTIYVGHIDVDKIKVMMEK